MRNFAATDPSGDLIDQRSERLTLISAPMPAVRRDHLTPKQFSTRHRASTSMYSLTFCVRFLLPEHHQRKPAVKAAAVTLRTPPVDGQSPASQPGDLQKRKKSQFFHTMTAQKSYYVSATAIVIENRNNGLRNRKLDFRCVHHSAGSQYTI